jgi:hypothetical protein
MPHHTEPEAQAQPGLITTNGRRLLRVARRN